MAYHHIDTKPRCVQIQSINSDRENQLNDLEAFLLAVQKMIKIQKNQGKKGIVLNKGQINERKVSYDTLQAWLFELHTLYGIRGAFSYGICKDCSKFANSCSATGTLGYCAGVAKTCFDSCSAFDGKNGGFGL